MAIWKKMLTAAICSMVLFIWVGNPLKAQAETKKAAIITLDSTQNLTVMFSFDAENVDIVFVSPSGKRFAAGDDGVEMVSGSLWSTYRIENAERGTWSVEYDLGANTGIDYSVIQDDYGLWIQYFQLSQITDSQMEVTFQADFSREERLTYYQYEIYAVDAEEPSVVNFLTNGSCAANREKQVTLNLSALSSGSYQLRLEVYYTERDVELFDSFVTEAFAFQNPNTPNTIEGYVTRINSSSGEFEVDWSDYRKWGRDAYRLVAYEDEELLYDGTLEADVTSSRVLFSGNSGKLRISLYYLDGGLWSSPLTKEIDLGQEYLMTDSQEVTGSSQLLLEYKVGKESQLYLRINGREAQYRLTDAGSLGVALEQGVNDVYAECQMDDQVFFIVDTQVYFDAYPPEITLFENLDGKTFHGDTVDILGRISGGSRLTANGKDVELGEENRFVISLGLAEGENVLALEAFDINGNSSVLTLTMYRASSVMSSASGIRQSYLPLFTALAVSALLILFSLIFLKKREKKQRTEKKVGIVKWILLDLVVIGLEALCIIQFVTHYFFSNSMEYLEMVERSAREAAEYLRWQRIWGIASVSGAAVCVLFILFTVWIARKRKKTGSERTKTVQS